MIDRPTPETDARTYVPSLGASTVPAEFARKLERERDEARDKVEQQRKEIVRLNGATSHAGGTPLKIALRERDEAREKMADALQEVDLRTLDFERIKEERDEVREERDKIQTELEMWREGNILHEINRNELEKVERERDNARGLLNKISDLFIDGTDIYADYENMGMIARNALEETK